MKQYKQPTVMNTFRQANIIPLAAVASVSAVEALSVGGALVAGALAGLASKGEKDAIKRLPSVERVQLVKAN